QLRHLSTTPVLRNADTDADADADADAGGGGLGGWVVHERIAAHAAVRPGHPAVVDATGEIREEISFGQLHDRARHLAGQLGQHLQTRLGGSGHGEPIVAVELPRGVDLVVAMLAVWYAGGVCLPVDPDYPPQRRAVMLADAQPDLHLTPTTLAHLTGPPADTTDMTGAAGAAEQPWTPAPTA
ncbi:AMP-binding protein, partial [Virgisporangium aurantiacum]|uniref:AMP-binding protein n=1 Tax=Virgisporangium aurantiacum TaxID=175570 RepID=UPI0019508AE1